RPAGRAGAGRGSVARQRRDGRVLPRARADEHHPDHEDEQSPLAQPLADDIRRAKAVLEADGSYKNGCKDATPMEEPGAATRWSATGASLCTRKDRRCG